MSGIHHPEASPGPSTNRIEAFSDGVFAIVITLLALEIRVPNVTPDMLGELQHKVFELWPEVVSYALSFVIVGIYWVGHHNVFNLIRHSNRALLWLNILFLMCVAFIPFPTAMLGRYGSQQSRWCCTA